MPQVTLIFSVRRNLVCPKCASTNVADQPAHWVLRNHWHYLCMACGEVFG